MMHLWAASERSLASTRVQKALDAMLLRHQGVAIVIAHRLTTVKNCDKIVCIDKGVEVPTPFQSSSGFIDRDTGFNLSSSVYPQLPFLLGFTHQIMRIDRSRKAATKS